MEYQSANFGSPNIFLNTFIMKDSWKNFLQLSMKLNKNMMTFALKIIYLMYNLQFDAFLVRI